MIKPAIVSVGKWTPNPTLESATIKTPINELSEDAINDILNGKQYLLFSSKPKEEPLK